jgi:hypothetical protein
MDPVCCGRGDRAFSGVVDAAAVHSLTAKEK